MIDLRLFKDNPEYLKNSCKMKNSKINIDDGIELYNAKNNIITELEQLLCKKNQISLNISKNIGNRETLIDESKEISAKINVLNERKNIVDKNINDLALSIPNHVCNDVPYGRGEQDNIIIKTVGEEPKYDFIPKPHWEICENLNLVDFKRGVKLSGSGFILYKGLGAKLERAIYNYFLDCHEENNYFEWLPPLLVNRESMIGTGQLPKMENDMYHCNEDDLFLIPTAEVPITNIHRNEILDERNLPLSYVAYSACFRREAGSAGKDTRGLLRVHEFNKVELVKFTTPENSYLEHEKLKNDVESILKKLGLHYRILLLCSGDTSFAAAKCYDFEAYAPGVDRFLEVSSCSNFEEFQARRANIKYKDSKGKNKFVHTLNASGLAVPRIMASILETYQQKDGSVIIPNVLRKYMNGLEKIS